MLPERVELVPAAGEQFMGVGLVPHIPDQFVLGEIKDVVDGNGEFNRTETGCQVSPGPRDDLYDNFTNFFRNFRKLGTIKLFQIPGAFDALKQAKLMSIPIFYA